MVNVLSENTVFHERDELVIYEVGGNSVTLSVESREKEYEHRKGESRQNIFYPGIADSVEENIEPLFYCVVIDGVKTADHSEHNCPPRYVGSNGLTSMNSTSGRKLEKPKQVREETIHATKSASTLKADI